MEIEIIPHEIYAFIDFQQEIAIITRVLPISSRVIIPSFANFQGRKYPIRIIKKEAFRGNRVTHQLSFENDSQLKTIEPQAFIDSAITTLSLPKTVQNLNCFCECHQALTEIHIPENSAFSYIRNSFLVKKITENNECDEYELIFARRDITIAKIPHNIKRILSRAFHMCRSLSHIEFEVNQDNNSSLEEIGDYCFYECTKLEAISFPASLKRIGNHAFTFCMQLNSVSFPEDSLLDTIGRAAFSNCRISTLTMPSKVKHIEGFCEFMHDLAEIVISPMNHYINGLSKDFILTDNNTVLAFANRNITAVVIPSSVKTIGKCAFHCCKLLLSVSFEPKHDGTYGIEIIEEKAFSYCSSLRSIELPPSIKYIGKNAFEVCKLPSFEFSSDSQLETIDEDAFYMASFDSIFLPAKVSHLEGFSLEPIRLGHFALAPSNPYFKLVSDSYLITQDDIHPFNNNVLIFALKNVENAVIPGCVKRIGKGAFDSNSYVKSINFTKDDNGVWRLEEISESSIACCPKLVSISIPPSVRTISKHAIQSCENLRKLVFISDNGLSKLETIETGAFCDLHNLEHVTIPSNVKYIGKYAFASSVSLSFIEILGENVEICNSAFEYCSNLRMVSIPNAKTLKIGIRLFRKTNECKLFVSSNATIQYQLE